MENNEKYIDRKSALRYMGVRGEVPPEIARLIDECETELSCVMTPRRVYSVFDKDELRHILEGDDVANHLKDSDKVVLLGATLGSSVDSLIRKYQATDVARALIADAEASAAIEVLCDEAEEEIARALGANLTSRFSPGYGDYPLDKQIELLNAIDAGRKIGVTAGESFMLSPSKSVTAVIGLTDKPQKREQSSCATCDMKDCCRYRKEGVRCGY